MKKTLVKKQNGTSLRGATSCARRWSVALLSLGALLAFVQPSFAGSTTPAEAGMEKRVLFRGTLPQLSSVHDGEHSIHIRLYRKDGALIHDEVLLSEVRQGTFDVLIGSSKPLVADVTQEYDIGITVDNGAEVRDGSKLSMGSTLSEGLLGGTLDKEQNKIITAIDENDVSATMAEHDAIDRGLLSSPYYGLLPSFPMVLSPLTGLNIEMSLAAPNMPSMDAYEMAKYGRISIEYNNFATIDGDLFGVAAQAMHVAHHLLLYAAGFTTDVNGDGMFLFTLGAARYQVGNSREEPFVNAPFVRFKYQTSNARIFGYSEFETTVHFRSYISGTIGVGLRVTNKVKIIGGLHHTEFVMPTEQQIRMVDGFHGIISWTM